MEICAPRKRNIFSGPAEDNHEESTVLDSIKHGGAKKNGKDEKIHCVGVTSKGIRPNKGYDATSPEPKAWLPTRAPKLEIRFGYDNFRSDYVKNDTVIYKHHEMTKDELQISLLPKGMGLQSIYQFENDEQSDI